MTYIENLRTYIADGFLYAKNSPNMQPAFRISYEEIVARRGTIFTTPCGTNINEFVPFYFSPATGMAYAIHMKRVPLRSTDGDEVCKADPEDVAYIVVDPQTLFASGRDCWFTNIACNSALPPVYEDNPGQLETHVEWPLFDDTSRMGHIPEIGYQGVCRWQHDQDDPPERQQRSKKRMAEFMVKDYLRMDEVSCIILKNAKRAGEVRAWVDDAGAAIPVYVKPGCYY